jgi:putative membrane protein insertion efficiency factor
MQRVANRLTPAELCLLLLRIYKQGISPWLPSACRFHPTCSVYMMEAITRFGAARGIWLGLRRLGRCHPFCEGGVDPVPKQ